MAAEKPAHKELQAFVDARKTPGLFFFATDPMDTFHVLKVQKALAGKKFESLDLVIHSGGGSIDAAFQIAELLRLHTKTLNACVPFYAKSAATLLCISSDEIILDELAQLGPLDAQVYEGKKSGKGQYVSALNPFKALEQLQSFSLQTLMTTHEMIDRVSELGTDECLRCAVEFVKATTAPLFAQLNPDKLGEYSRALNVGKEYGERLLRRFSKIENQKRAEILEKLVHGYPSHDYIIDHHELRELGFKTRLFTEEESKAAESLYTLFADTATKRLIECVMPTPEQMSLPDTKTSGQTPSTNGDKNEPVHVRTA